MNLFNKTLVISLSCLLKSFCIYDTKIQIDKDSNKNVYKEKLDFLGITHEYKNSHKQNVRGFRTRGRKNQTLK